MLYLTEFTEQISNRKNMIISSMFSNSNRWNLFYRTFTVKTYNRILFGLLSPFFDNDIDAIMLPVASTCRVQYGAMV